MQALLVESLLQLIFTVIPPSNETIFFSSFKVNFWPTRFFHDSTLLDNVGFLGHLQPKRQNCRLSCMSAVLKFS